MSRFKRILILVIPFSFLMGIYWGFLKIQTERQRPPSKGEIRLLALENFLPKGVQDWIFEQHKIRVHVTEAKNEVALLQAIQTSGRDFDIIQLPSYLSKVLIHNEFFIPINKNLVPSIKNISVDFLNLEYDSTNTYLLPISWGLNGFIYNKTSVKDPQYSVKEILTDKDLQGKVSLLPSSIEILTATKIMFPIVEAWINNEESKPIIKSLKSLKPVFIKDEKLISEALQKGDLLYSQLSNGKSAAFIDQTHRFEFFLPDEKSNLWVNLLAISKQSFQTDLAHDFINLLLHNETSKVLVNETSQATILKTLDETEIHPMQRASFLRKVELNKISISKEKTAFQPTWTKSLEKALPDFYSRASLLKGSQ